MQTTTLYSFFYWFLFALYWLSVASATVRILFKRRPNSITTAWLLVVYIFPFFGLFAYLTFGELKIGKRREEQVKTIWPETTQKLGELIKLRGHPDNISPLAKSLFNLCEIRQNIPSTHANEIQTFTNSDDTMQQMVVDINQAQDNIKMVFYIWSVGGKETDVVEALCAAARRGVKCRILVDSAGSHHFFRSKHHKQMVKAGVQIASALPVSLIRAFFRRMDLRQHRKMVLIDDHIAYTGSMNMVDPKFFKQEAGVGEWIDLMIRMDGSVCLLMEAIFNNDWQMETKQSIPFGALAAIGPTAPVTPPYITQVIASGPGFPEEIIQQTLLSVIYAAQEKIVFTTPYFVPSDDLCHAICTAAQRGVEVVLIIPKKCDSRMINWASKAFFTELLEAGVTIKQFSGGLLHTKSILIDEQLSLVGTVNLDIRSLWLNFEITVAIDSAEFAKCIKEIHDVYLQQTTTLALSEWAKRPLRQHILERLFYFFSPFL